MTTLAEAPITDITNAPTSEGGACPTWCEVETEFGGHDDWDGGEMHHWWGDSIEMSAWPYLVEGELYHHSLHVARKQVRDGAPFIEIAIPYRPEPPHPFGGTAEAGAVLTMAEAAELVASLQEAIGLGEVRPLTD